MNEFMNAYFAHPTILFNAPPIDGVINVVYIVVYISYTYVRGTVSPAFHSGWGRARREMASSWPVRGIRFTPPLDLYVDDAETVSLSLSFVCCSSWRIASPAPCVHAKSPIEDDVHIFDAFTWGFFLVLIPVSLPFSGACSIAHSHAASPTSCAAACTSEQCAARIEAQLCKAIALCLCTARNGGKDCRYCLFVLGLLWLVRPWGPSLFIGAAGWSAGRLVRRRQLQEVRLTNSMASNMCSCVHASVCST
jgi:hypothetical protein